jgi:CheY-like chemotaxis protein
MTLPVGTRDILIVEDDDAIATGLSLNLRLAGHNATIAPDGEVALDELAEKVFDLVLLDINLPRKNGLEVLGAMRDADNIVPVIVLSARDGEYDKVAALRLGADDYVTKPFALAELLARIDAVLLGVGGLGLGFLLGALGVCPIVKRIWTPSWAIFSGGWVMLLLAGFVAVIEWQGWKRWAFPLVVAGVNPITLYCLWQLSGGFIRRSLQTHLGQDVFASLGALYVPMLERSATLLVFWLILLWMYRRRIFLRI